jgi:gas vesicle protein
MASHQGAKDFLMGALIGGVIGVAAVSFSGSGSRKKRQSAKHLMDTIGHVGKAIGSKGGNSLSELIDWTTEGLQLWNKLKKGS